VNHYRDKPSVDTETGPGDIDASMHRLDPEVSAKRDSLTVKFGGNIEVLK
jgi:hypothetical protein